MKWIQEKVLIKYWTDNCSKYQLKDGTKILSSQHSIPLDAYPDISSNSLSDGRNVPAEIEWKTSSFEQHKHNISTLKDNDGFLIVFEKDQESFPVEQVLIDSEDFKQWFIKNAEKLVIDTVQSVKKKTLANKEPQIFLYYLPRTRMGKINLSKAMPKGTWGFPEKNTRGLDRIMQLKKGDIVVIVHNWKSSPDIKVTGGRLSSEKYLGTYEKVFGLVVTKGYYFAKKPLIWDNEIYPHRFDFRKEPLFEGNEVDCSKKALGNNLHEILRKLQVSGQIEKIDSSLIVKFMSVFTKIKK